MRLKPAFRKGLITAAASLVAFVAASGQDEEESEIVRMARERGRTMKVHEQVEDPAVIAVRIRHDMCPVCMSIERDFDPISELANDLGVLIVTIDLSTEEARRQSALLTASLGLKRLWPADLSGMGSVILVDGRSRETLETLQTDDLEQIEAAIWRAVDAHDVAGKSLAGSAGMVTGRTAQMEELEWMEGEWDVSIKTLNPDGTTLLRERTTSKVVADLDGCILRESMEVQVGPGGPRVKVMGLRSFDQFRGVYRFVWLENMAGLLDVFEGVKDSSGRIVATNVRSDTSLPNSSTGAFLHTRVSFARQSDDRFAIRYEISGDHGRTWKEGGNLEYTRRDG